MAIKTIPLSRLETNLKATLGECADTGEALIVQLPDDRLVYIQGVRAGADDELSNELISSNPGFRALLERSKSAPRKPFGSQ